MIRTYQKSSRNSYDGINTFRLNLDQIDLGDMAGLAFKEQNLFEPLLIEPPG